MGKKFFLVIAPVLLLVAGAEAVLSQPRSGMMQGPGGMGADMMQGCTMSQDSRMGAVGMGMMMRMAFILMDADGDGALSLEEFRAGHDRIFKGLDANKDGRLSFDEMQSFMHTAGPSQREMPGR